MSQDRPDRPPTARFLDALEVKRNAKIGLVSGVGVATALFVFFVALAPDTRGSPIYYVGLAFVVATTLAGAVAVVLTIRSAIALSRELEDVDRPEDV